MSDFKITDNAVYGVSDISGVKNVEPSVPGGEAADGLCAADMADKTEALSENQDMSVLEEEDEATLDAEFEALINGKYGRAYRKRTESIVRKRLRSVKAHTEREKGDASEAEGKNMLEVAFQNKAINNVSETIKSNSSEVLPKKEAECSEAKNKNRPIENGLCGSNGIINRVNVSMLDGKEVLAIIKRVGSGEKISFK